MSQRSVVLGLLLLAGCAHVGTFGDPRERFENDALRLAASDMECPLEDLSTTYGRGQDAFVVQGCGKTSAYRCRPAPRPMVRRGFGQLPNGRYENEGNGDDALLRSMDGVCQQDNTALLRRSDGCDAADCERPTS